MKTPDDSQGVRMNDKGVKVKFAARISCFLPKQLQQLWPRFWLKKRQNWRGRAKKLGQVQILL